MIQFASFHMSITFIITTANQQIFFYTYIPFYLRIYQDVQNPFSCYWSLSQPLKTSENQRFFIFRGVQKENSGMKWVNTSKRFKASHISRYLEVKKREKTEICTKPLSIQKYSQYQLYNLENLGIIQSFKNSIFLANSKQGTTKPFRDCNSSPSIYFANIFQFF